MVTMMETENNHDFLDPLDNPVILQRFNYHTRLKRLVHYMKEHPADPLRLNVAASIVCMEKTAFCKYFKRTVGMTFRRFVQKWKIANAVKQMIASDRSISELAYALGFENINTFGRTFKRITAMTPSEYRKHALLNQQIASAIISEKRPITRDN